MIAVQTLSRYRWVILALAVLAQVGVALASQSLPPLAALFQPDLGLTKTEVGLFSSAAFAGAWSVLLVMGSVTDRFGIRRVMSLGLLVSGALLLSMGAASTALQAGLVMFVVGVARGAVFPGSTKAIMDWFPASARGAFMGVKQTGQPLGGIFVAATLPAIALTMGWRAAIGLAGFAIVAIGVANVVLYRDPERHGSAPTARPPVFAGIRDVLRNRTLWFVGIVGMLFMMSQQGLLSYLALYLKEVVLVPTVPDEKARIVAAGGFLATCQMGGIFGRVFWGWLSDRRFRERRLVVFAGVGAANAAVLLVVAGLEPGTSPMLLTGLIFAGGATAVGWNGIFHALIAEAAGRERAGSGVGFCSTLVESGAMTGPPLFGLVVDHTGSYQFGWLLASGLAACGTLIAAVATRRAGSKSSVAPGTSA